MMPFRGQARWAKMMSLTVLAYHPTKKLYKAEELTYLSTNVCRKKGCSFPV
jgi:hypothetical protein